MSAHLQEVRYYKKMSLCNLNLVLHQSQVPDLPPSAHTHVQPEKHLYRWPAAKGLSLAGHVNTT